jgi:hypothetical protein
MQLSATVGNQVFECFKIAVYDFSFFEAVDDFGIDVRAATNGRSVAQHLSRFLDCCHHLSFACRTFLDRLGSYACKGTGTNNRAGPGAKVFGAEFRAHNLLDVFVDVTVGNIDEFAVAVLILEDFPAGVTEQASHDFRDLAIF